jgi:plastocyanin
MVKGISINNSPFLLIAILLAILSFLAACGNNNGLIPTSTVDNSPNTSPSALTPNAPGLFEVFITENGFVPQEITIEVGSTLTWINKDVTWRAVGEEIPTGESGFDYPYGASGQLQPGETFSRKFNLPGIWDYWCPKTLQLGRVFIEEIE